MITLGFVASYSDEVTIDQPITAEVNGESLPLISSYIVAGTGGDIVWLNGLGIAQFLPGAQANQAYPIGASQIVSSGVVNGNSRTTTASDLVWLASPSAA